MEGCENVKCRYVKKKLIDYVDGNLGTEEREIVQEHISKCNDCHNELAIVKKLTQLVHRVDYPPVSVWNNFLNDLHKRIETEAALESNRRQRYSLQSKWILAIVSIISLLFASAYIIPDYYPLSKPVKPLQSRSYNGDLLMEASESTLIASLISKVLISDSEAKELKKLNKFIDSDTFQNTNSYYDILHSIGTENSKDSDPDLIQFFLKEGIADLNDSIIQTDHSNETI